MLHRGEAPRPERHPGTQKTGGEVIPRVRSAFFSIEFLTTSDPAHCASRRFLGSGSQAVVDRCGDIPITLVTADESK